MHGNMNVKYLSCSGKKDKRNILYIIYYFYHQMHIRILGYIIKMTQEYRNM